MIQKIKKPISILLVFMMIISLFAAVPMTVNAAPPGSGGGGTVIPSKTITLYANNGTDQSYSQSNTGGMLNVTNPLAYDFTTPENKMFSSWNTQPDGTGADYGSSFTYNFSSDLTLYAQWVTLYTVTWNNWDDTELDTDEVEEGATPSYTGETPTKDADENYTYTFAGWKVGETTYALNEALPPVTGDVTYTATYTATPCVASVTSSGTTTKYSDFNAALSAWTDGSTLTLLTDVTTSSTITAPTGETNLCLNGKTINANGGNFAVITIGNGCTLNLYDPEGGGIITGANHTADGGGVAITNGGHFNMYGGSIEGNRSTNGGGVSVNGSNAAFHMYGGAIQYNEGYHNTGGILLGGNTVLTLSGGTIRHNAGLNFGGIGTYQGTIVIDGDVNISDNYMYSGGTANKITKSEGAYSLDTTGGMPANVKTAHSNDRIKVTNQLTLTHKIGVIRQGDTGVFTTGYTTSGNTADPSEYFYSDAFGFNVTLNANGEAELSPIYIRMGTYNGLDVDWFTAGSNGNGLMIVSKYALKNMQFGTNATYSSSYIHNWLEGTFATELGLTEKELSLAKTLSLQYGDGTDKFVIPSYEEFNGKALTKAYYINDPSTVAPAYWFRTRRTNDSARLARYQYDTVDMRWDPVTYTNAVRPMFYLDADAFSSMTMTGSGTEADPYVIENKHSINNDISPDAASVLATVKENGTTIYDAGLPTKTIADTEVTVSVTPNEGYIVSNVKVNDEDIELTDNQDGTYSFVMPAKNIIVTADVEKKKFEVTWKNEDGSVIDTTSVEYGDMPTHADPTKADDETNTYTFAGWTPAIAPVTEDVTYTATFTATAKPKDLFPHHSITLGGNIGVNFYIDSAAADFANASSAVVKFTWDGGGEDRTKEVDLKALTPDTSTGYYKATVDVVAAQMAHKIHAEVYLNGEKLDQTDDYSVQDYAETVFENPEAYDDKGKPDELKALAKALLNYGAMAQTVFASSLKEHPALANTVVGNNGYEGVTADQIEGAINGSAFTVSDVETALGAKFYTSSLIYLSRNTLRLYFTPTTYPGTIPNADKYAGNLSGYYYYVDAANIPAAELDNQQTFDVNGYTFTFSALDYAKAIVESTKMGPNQQNLAKALYLYNKAANAYFDAAPAPVQNIVDLSTVTEDTVVENGYTITGTLKGDYKISIADGATVTLKDATITCLTTGAAFAGINPVGDATIKLEGANTVKGGFEDYPGIFVPENTTLTIDGTGSLTASSGGDEDRYGCGIGGGFDMAAGNIVINGGTITANGGDWAAGIGSGDSVSCGNITITGGTITANGGALAAGIGSGNSDSASCGNITITGGTITANGGEYAAGIGSGYDEATCSNILITGGTITANGGQNSAAIGSGGHATCGNITIAATVTQVTATKGDYSPDSIGRGYGGTCGTVTIAPGANVTQN